VALVNEAVRAESSSYVGGMFLGTVNVAVLPALSFYGEGHLVGTGESGGMFCIEGLCRGTFGGHW